MAGCLFASVVAWLDFTSSLRGDSKNRRGNPGYPEYMRDLVRILNKFSIKIYLTGLPRSFQSLAMTFRVSTQQCRNRRGEASLRRRCCVARFYLVIAKPRSGCGNPGYPEYMRDLVRILNKFSIKIYLTGLPRSFQSLAMTFMVSTQQCQVSSPWRVSQSTQQCLI
jgi:hypothetical protein